MITTTILAMTLSIPLVPPKYGAYIGELPGNIVCGFLYGSGTDLTSGTELSIDPYIEEYGEGSLLDGEPIEVGDSAYECGSCWVTSIVVDKYNVTTINCEMGR